MQIRVQTPLEHGVLFILDPYGDAKIPEDTGATAITFTRSCVCFPVTSHVDGEADVIITNRPMSGRGNPSFYGVIEAKGKYISLLDSRDNYYCLLRLTDEHADVHIWSYHEDGADRTWVQISNLEIF